MKTVCETWREGILSDGQVPDLTGSPGVSDLQHKEESCESRRGGGCRKRARMRREQYPVVTQTDGHKIRMQVRYALKSY